MKNSWTRTKENVKKITKRNNLALNFRQAEWTKKSTKENEIKLCRIDRITVESTFSATGAARAERERWHSTIYESIYLYLISFLICPVTSSSLIPVSPHHNIWFLSEFFILRWWCSKSWFRFKTSCALLFFFIDNLLSAFEIMLNFTERWRIFKRNYEKYMKTRISFMFNRFVFDVINLMIAVMTDMISWFV
jgi:hypothetical protein